MGIRFRLIVLASANPAARDIFARTLQRSIF